MDSNIHFNALRGPINNVQYERQNLEESFAFDVFFSFFCKPLFWFAELVMIASLQPEAWISR